MALETTIRSYRDLVVWQRAIELIKETYRVTQSFPTTETYGLIAQMRRSAVSIAANIAEGHARSTAKDYLRFLFIATGSLRELETYWEVAIRIELTHQDELAKSISLGEELGKMLTRLRQSLGRIAGSG